jgi:hypothetical protein
LFAASPRRAAFRLESWHDLHAIEASGPTGAA